MNNQWSTKSIVNNLIMLNVVIFLIQWLSPEFDARMTQSMGLHFVQSKSFHLYQLVTYMFLHGSFYHLFFNMFALWMFGRISEWDLGSKRFLIYYFVTGIGAGLVNFGFTSFQYYSWVAEYGINHPQLLSVVNSSVTIGASGAVFGILLSFGLMHPNERIMLLIPPIPMKAKYFVITYGVLELILGVQANDNVAHFAHLGGMIFGIFLLLFWKRTGKIYF